MFEAKWKIIEIELSRTLKMRLGSGGAEILASTGAFKSRQDSACKSTPNHTNTHMRQDCCVQFLRQGGQF